MPAAAELDSIVARAQRGDAAALEALCARARPLLVRHARRLLRRSADVEDAVQEVLMLVCARIGTYRWEGSFAGWLYAIATRSILRRAAAAPPEAALAVELAESALVSDYEPMTEAEWRLVVGDLGRPQDPLMRLTVRATVQLLDGVRTTALNVRGGLPDVLEDAGLRAVSVRDRTRTPTGSYEIITARR